MPKYPPYESAIHHFLLQAKKIAEIERLFNPSEFRRWRQFVESLQFEKIDSSTARVRWRYPSQGVDIFSFAKAKYYTRGDTASYVQTQKLNKRIFTQDAIRQENDKLFFDLVLGVSKRAGLLFHLKHTPMDSYDVRSLKRYHDEEHLSDEWAKSVDVKKIDVLLMNESCTAPEMRYIMKRLGSIKGKSILDIGCGLGEASVYFVLQGARVMAMDISHHMTSTTLALAKENGVTLRTHQSSIEHFVLPRKERFDIIYVGNLFHHVDIDKALERILVYLKPKGVLVSWDPVDYNPIINIYRKIATEVRSRDERPIRLSDIEKFRRKFSHIETRWFWLAPQIIFVVMALIERRNPNKERFWKAVVKEGEKWAWLYSPLEKFDALLFSIFPILKFLCWNVVMIASKPKKIPKKI